MLNSARTSAKPNPARTRLSLAMITRNNESMIRAALNSAAAWVDEIVVVDTGSTDRTKSICQDMGAHVFDFPWCDDFSAARNESLRHCSGDWVFWMDSDDILPPSQGRRLRSLVSAPLAGSECKAFVLQVHCTDGRSGHMTIVDHVKVFPNWENLRFEFRIHEQILPSIRRLGGEVIFTNIHVVHIGTVHSQASRASKLARDLRLLELEQITNPNHPFVLFNLGMTYDDAERFEDAVTVLRDCVRRSSAGDSHLRKAWSILSNSLRCLGRHDQALEAINEGLVAYPADPELLFRRGALNQTCGWFEQAVHDYRHLLELPSERVFQSIDPTIVGFKLHHNLAICFYELGQRDNAVASWEAAVKLNSSFTPAWLCLFRDAESQMDSDRLEWLLAQLPSNPDCEPVRAILMASQQRRKGRIDLAIATLRTGWQNYRNEACLDELARLTVDQQDWNGAVELLIELARLCPLDAAVFHNLGMAFQRTGAIANAIESLQRSLDLRPDAVHSRHLLADLLKSTKGS